MNRRGLSHGVYSDKWTKNNVVIYESRHVVRLRVKRYSTRSFFSNSTFLDGWSNNTIIPYFKPRVGQTYVLPRVCRNEVIVCSRPELRNLIHNHYILSPLFILVRLARVERAYTHTTRTNKGDRYICRTRRKRFSTDGRVLKYVGKGEGGCGPEK